MRNLFCKKLALERVRFQVAQVCSLIHDCDQVLWAEADHDAFKETLYHLLIAIDQDVTMVEGLLQEDMSVSSAKKAAFRKS